MKPNNMADSLPTISADQLTKAVSLAAAGTLAALDADNSEDEWHNNDQDSDMLPAKKIDAQPLQTSLKLMETLSSSVTSNLAKLNQQLDMQKPGLESESSVRKSLQGVGRIKHYDGTTLPTIRKYSSRKNYKLLPPLMANQSRAPLLMPGPDVVVPKQIVTLSHRPNLCSPQELKSMPVRLARYTTSYLLLRSTTPPQNSSFAEKTDEVVVSKSLESVDDTSSRTKKFDTSSLTAPVVTNVTPATSAPVVPANSKIMIPLLPRVLPQSQSVRQIPVSVVISRSNGGRNNWRSESSTLRPNIQPSTRLPLTLNNRMPNQVGSLKLRACPPDSSIIYVQEICNMQRNDVIPSLVSECQSPKSISNSLAHIQIPVLHQESVSGDLTKTFSGGENSATLSCLRSVYDVDSKTSEQTSLVSSKHPQHAAVPATSSTRSSVCISTNQTSFCDNLHQVNSLLSLPSSSKVHGTGTNSASRIFAKPNMQKMTAAVPLNSDPSCLEMSSEISTQHIKVRPVLQSNALLSNVVQTHIRPTITPALSCTVSPLNLSQPTTKPPTTSPPCVQVSSGIEPQISSVLSTTSLPVAISPNMILTPPVFSKPTSHLIWSTKQVTDKSSALSRHGAQSSSPRIFHEALKITGRQLPVSSTALPSNNMGFVGIISPVSLNATQVIKSSSASETLNSGGLKTDSKIPSLTNASTSCDQRVELVYPERFQASTVHSCPVLSSILSVSNQKVLPTIPNPSQTLGEVKYPTSAPHLPRNPSISFVSSTQASHLCLRAPLCLLRATSRPMGVPPFTVINSPLFTKNPQTLGKKAEKQCSEMPSSLAAPSIHPQVSHITATKSSVQNNIAQTNTHALAYESSDESNSSAHFSTAAAVAAMVSLSETNTFDSMNTLHHAENTSTNSSFPITSSNEVGRVQSSTTTLKERVSQFLIPSGDRTKLVISPAGIQHLQLLLRKQGMSEGYFVITSPRAPLTACSKGDTVTTVNPTFSESLPKNQQLNEGMNYASLFQKPKLKDARPSNSDKNSTLKSLLATSTLKTEWVKNEMREKDPGNVHKTVPHNNTDSKFVDTEDSDSENSTTSSVSRSSSAALVIETGEDEEQMEMGSTSSDVTAAENVSLVKGRKSEHESNMFESCHDDLGQKSGRQQEDTNWDTDVNHGNNENGCVPQSPLSLSDLIRQQQNRSSFSRHSEFSYLSSPDSKAKEIDEGLRGSSDTLQLPSSVSEEFTFPMPICPTSSYSSMAHQHINPEVHTGYQHSLYPSASLFSNDITFETSSHPAHLDSRARQNIVEASSGTSPKMLSTPMSVPSPKSPLSVSSSQALDHNAPLNPPMTPNTMLINLLNRVPTPLLTNHQDLLSVPTSLENNIQHNENGACLGNFEMIAGKRSNGMFPGKRINYTDNVDQQQSENQNLLYTEGSRQLAPNRGKYESVQNDIELSYNNSNLGGNDSHMVHIDNRSSLHSFDGESFSHCTQQGGGSSVDLPESYCSKDHNLCHNFHCKACSGPLVVTVNLDSHSPTRQAAGPAQRNVEKSTELLEHFESSSQIDTSLNLQKLNCIQGSPGLPQSMVPQKSSDTDILRHLILSTSSSSFHTMQPAEVLRSQHYEVSPSVFSLTQDHLPQPSHFACQVESFLEPENHCKETRESNQNQTQSFSAHNDNFLHMDSHSHDRPSPSFDSTNTAFKNTTFSDSVHSSYENPVTSTFGNENNATMGSQPNTSYIMQASLSNDPTYSAQDLSKNNIPFLGSDERLQHLNEFRTDEHQDDMYYQHSQQGDLHRQTTLHLYDPTSQHQNHDLEYHMDSMPQPHQAHQYSAASLSHPDTSRIFEDHPENVGFMESPYSTQYYSNGNVTTDLPMFSQQCAVGSEAPVLGNTANHPCNIPFSSAPTGLQLEFHFPTEDEDDATIEKQPVLPSASFSPPSVADQAVTPDPGGMGMYNGTFPNLSMYELYMRGGNTDGRCAENDAAQELGNFCVECNLMYKVQCKFHPCDYTYISDTPILSHARLTLPACLRVGTSDIVGHTNNTGVFAKEAIAVRTKFGPLIGSPVSCDKLGSTRSFSLWQTFSGTATKVVDTSDENSSNWLMFVKPARLSSEQNLVAFQHGSSVYFVTRVNIEPDQELLYWFSKDYARTLGITANPKNAHHQLCPHCNVCKQVFPDRKQVRSHTRIQHPKPCTKKCSHCSRRFSQVSHLNAHITSVHLRVKKFVCPNCGKRFSDSSNFRKHVKSHSDERCFKCQMCGKSFRQKAHLMHHMNTHMPVKNEECGFCGERFTRAFTRKQHELQHTKQNKIQCTYCEKVFYKQQVYKQHLKIHRNERNYVCTHCTKAFRTKANLTRHGPACKQKKCILPLPTPSSVSTMAAPLHKAVPTLPTEFLHASHPDVTVSSYSNDTKASSDSI